MTKTRARTKTRTKGRSRRGRGAGQSVVPSDSDSDSDINNRWADKKIVVMEEGKPWYTAPSKRGPVVDPNLNAAKLIQTENDNIDFEAASNQGLTFGGKKKSKRRKINRRKRTRRKRR